MRSPSRANESPCRASSRHSLTAIWNRSRRNRPATKCLHCSPNSHASSAGCKTKHRTSAKRVGRRKGQTARFGGAARRFPYEETPTITGPLIRSVQLGARDSVPASGFEPESLGARSGNPGNARMTVTCSLLPQYRQGRWRPPPDRESRFNRPADFPAAAIANGTRNPDEACRAGARRPALVLAVSDQWDLSSSSSAVRWWTPTVHHNVATPQTSVPGFDIPIVYTQCAAPTPGDEKGHRDQASRGFPQKEIELTGPLRRNRRRGRLRWVQVSAFSASALIQLGRGGGDRLALRGLLVLSGAPGGVFLRTARPRELHTVRSAHRKVVCSGCLPRACHFPHLICPLAASPPLAGGAGISATHPGSVSVSARHLRPHNRPFANPDKCGNVGFSAHADHREAGSCLLAGASFQRR